MEIRKIRDGFYWTGIIDKKIKVFDIVMKTEFGSSYNSYILETSAGLVLFENIKMYLDENKLPSFRKYLEHLHSITPDLKKIMYIVMDHTEPDHSGSIKDLLKYCNRNCKIIASKTACEYLGEIFNKKLPFIPVSQGNEIKIGDKTLVFYDIPMLHWPDSMFTLIKEDKIAVTCDTLGAHYAHDDLVISKMDESTYKVYQGAFIHYYNTIMSPFKSFILLAMDKLEKLFNEGAIDMIATGHGSILDDKKRIKWAIDTYKDLSTPKNPYKKPLLLFVTCSAYNYTQEITDVMCNHIEKKYFGEYIIHKYNIDVITYPKQKAQILKDLDHAKIFFVGTPTINNDAIPLIWDLLSCVKPLESAAKIACSYGSYGWSGEGVKNITQRLHQLKFRTVKAISFKFRISEFDLPKIHEYVDNIVNYHKTKKVDDPTFVYRNESWNDTKWK